MKPITPRKVHGTGTNFPQRTGTARDKKDGQKFATSLATLPEATEAHRLRCKLETLEKKIASLKTEIEIRATRERALCQQAVDLARKPEAPIEQHSKALKNQAFNEAQIAKCESDLKASILEQSQISSDFEKATVALDEATIKLKSSAPVEEKKPARPQQPGGLKQIFGAEPINAKGKLKITDAHKTEMERLGLLSMLCMIARFQSKLHETALARAKASADIALVENFRTRGNHERPQAEVAAENVGLSHRRSLIEHFDAKVPPMKSAIQQMRKQFENMYAQLRDRDVDAVDDVEFENVDEFWESYKALDTVPPMPAALPVGKESERLLKSIIAGALAGVSLFAEVAAAAAAGRSIGPGVSIYTTLLAAVVLAESNGNHRVACAPLALLAIMAFFEVGNLMATPSRLPDPRN